MSYVNTGCRCDYCRGRRQEEELRITRRQHRQELADALQREARIRDRISFAMSVRSEAVGSAELHHASAEVAVLRKKYGRQLEAENAQLLRLLRRSWCQLGR